MGSKLVQLLFLCIVVFASIRGAFVFHFGFPANITYIISSIMVLGFGSFALLKLITTKLDLPLVMLKNAIILNSVFFIFFIISSLLIAFGSGASASSVLSMFYFFLVFPIVFIFLRYDDVLLDRIVYFIAFITVFGVYLFFNFVVAGGIDEVQKAYSILRPGEFNYSRIGMAILPAGYSGSHHDTANILVMCGIFMLAKFLTCDSVGEKALFLAFYFLILFAGVVTGSAANLLVFFLVSLFMFFTYLSKSRASLLFACLFVLILLLLMVRVTTSLDSNEISDLTYVFKKLNPDTIPEEIWYGLDFESLKNSLLSIFLGFGGFLKSPLIEAEVAFMSLLSRFGLLPFCILMFIGFAPIYYFFIYKLNSSLCVKFFKRNMSTNLTSKLKSETRIQFFRLLVFAMPVLAGFLTLIHYGSVFRITSICLFCVLLSKFLKEYLSAHKFIESYSIKRIH